MFCHKNKKSSFPSVAKYMCVLSKSHKYRNLRKEKALTLSKEVKAFKNQVSLYGRGPLVCPGCRLVSEEPPGVEDVDG